MDIGPDVINCLPILPDSVCLSLQPWLYKSFSGSLQFIFSKIASHVDAFLIYSWRIFELSVLLCCLDLFPPQFYLQILHNPNRNAGMIIFLKLIS